MKALVTGSAGLLGSAVIAKLLESSDVVRATYHNAPPVIADKRIEYVKADLTNLEDCRKVIGGMERVYLCAACTGGVAINSSSHAPVTRTLAINANMLEACAISKVERVGVVSSTTVYPDGTEKFREDQGFEAEPYKGYFGIGWMNRYIEKLTEYFYRAGAFKAAIIRPTNIYGPNDDYNLATAHVLPALIAKICGRMNPLEVWGDGSQIRDFIYVEDVAQAMLLAVEKSADCVAMNIGSGEAMAIRELIPLIMELSGNTDLEVKFDPSKPTAIPVRVVDTALAQERIGFVPANSIRDGLTKTIFWYMNGRNKQQEQTQL